MGAVYRGYQHSLKRAVAIKILPAEIAEDPTFVERFRREAVALAALDHPNIVAAFDYGELTNASGEKVGICFLVMELIEGTDLAQIIKAGELSQEQSLTILEQVCDALCYSHDRGYVHRDVKPANIFVDREGRVKVGDFGLAKVMGGDDNLARDELGLTLTGQAIGTPNYIAPEMLSDGSSFDHRADIYALGVVLYEMLTGEIPRGAFRLPSKKKDGIARTLDPIVTRAMEQDPKHRYQTTIDFKVDLRRAASIRTSGRFGRRAVALAAISLLVSALAVLGLMNRDANQEDELPPSEATTLPYQPLPELPLVRAMVLGRIVILPGDAEHEEAEPLWAKQIQDDDYSDIVAAELTTDGDLVLLRSNGHIVVYPTQTDGSTPDRVADFRSDPRLAQGNYVRLVPNLEALLNRGTELKNLRSFDVCDSTSVEIGADGAPVFGDGEINAHFRKAIDEHQIDDAIEVTVGAAPDRCFILRENGTWQWNLRGDAAGGDQSISGDDCIAALHLSRGYIDSKGSLRILGKRWGQGELALHFAAHGQFVKDVGAADRGYCIALKRPDESVRIFYRSRDPIQLCHLEPVLHGAIRIFSFAQHDFLPKHATFAIALLPAEGIERSAFWNPTALLESRRLQGGVPLAVD